MEQRYFFSSIFVQNTEKENILFFQMTTHQWDLKSNYMLTFAVDKHGIGSDQWTRVAKDLSDFIQTTAEVRFERLCSLK